MTRDANGPLFAGRLGLFAAILLAVLPAAAGAATPTSTKLAPWKKGEGPGSLSGVWLLSDYKTSKTFDILESAMKTEDGQLPPYQPWAAELYQKRLEMSRKGDPFAGPRTQCQPGGVPQSMFGPMLLMEVLETPGKVTILFEEFTNFRQIFLGAKHADDPDPTFFGDSVGHWEGDTLVVDTIGLSDRTVLDTVGGPHSEDLHLTERIRRTGPTTLEDEVTFDDPKVFTKVWKARTHFTLKPTDKLREDICTENRNAPTAEGTVGLMLKGQQPAK